jgi:hypothetical protein
VDPIWYIDIPAGDEELTNPINRGADAGPTVTCAYVVGEGGLELRSDAF